MVSDFTTTTKLNYVMDCVMMILVDTIVEMFGLKYNN